LVHDCKLLAATFAKCRAPGSWIATGLRVGEGGFAGRVCVKPTRIPRVIGRQNRCAPGLTTGASGCGSGRGLVAPTRWSEPGTRLPSRSRHPDAPLVMNHGRSLRREASGSDESATGRSLKGEPSGDAREHQPTTLEVTSQSRMVELKRRRLASIGPSRRHNLARTADGALDGPPRSGGQRKR
jgi:hypothetical protein